MNSKHALFIIVTILIVSRILGSSLVPTYLPVEEHPNLKLKSYNHHMNLQIINGEPTYIENYPFLVFIVINHEHHCGGSIIHHSIILSAAHCVYGTVINSLIIYAGVSNLEDSRRYVGKVLSYIYHPQYSPFTMDYDITLLRLANPLELTNKIQLANIDNVDWESKIKGTYQQVQGTVVGWGYTNKNNSINPDLNKITLLITSNRNCNSFFYPHPTITNRMFCATFPKTSPQAPCKGDSGGPFIVNHKVYGLVSFGRKCGAGLAPSTIQVYTRLPNANITAWIPRAMQMLLNG